METYVTPAPADPFARSRIGFESLVEDLASGRAGQMPHDHLEELIEVRGREVQRQPLQEHLHLRAVREQEALPAARDQRRVEGRSRIERGHERTLATVAAGIAATVAGWSAYLQRKTGHEALRAGRESAEAAGIRAEAESTNTKDPNGHGGLSLDYLEIQGELKISMVPSPFRQPLLSMDSIRVNGGNVTIREAVSLSKSVCYMPRIRARDWKILHGSENRYAPIVHRQWFRAVGICVRQSRYPS